MASSDGLDEDCVLQRGRSQSDPSSITEVRLGEAHRAGKRGDGGGWGGVNACEACVTWLIGLRWSALVGQEPHDGAAGARLHPSASAAIPLNLYATNVGCVVNVRHLLSHAYTLLRCAVGPVCQIALSVMPFTAISSGTIVSCNI